MTDRTIFKDYIASDCTTFCKTKDPHGGLSMMAGGFPIRMGRMPVRTGEHLFQAMRFTEYPDIQKQLLACPSPMAAKYLGKTHLEKTRADWDEIRIEVMEWVLDLKLLNNIDTFGAVLQQAGDRPIVEVIHRENDPLFWGARPLNDGSDILHGKNILGILLWLLRKRFVENLQLYFEPHRKIPKFHFLDQDAVQLACQGIGMA